MYDKIHIVKYKLGSTHLYGLKTDYFYARINFKFTFESIGELCENLSHSEFMWDDYFLFECEDEIIVESFLELEDIKEKYIEYFV